MVSFFFFKKKTAYEMRISDWSSDVCSSDLGAEPKLLHFLYSDVQLGQRLQHQALSDEQLVFRLNARRDVALLADEERGIDFEELRRQALQAEHRVGPLWVWLEIVAHADLRIEEVGDQAAVEQLDLRLLELAI